ncbi:LAMI_0H10528g1_1 [Lachancea mirantina]|uniref:Protein BTN n=1 Tax=Lachancea mirantina TaxID=1230905 RepID=A0A1G4KGU1_9SACH|nr:LAMI_0H10528g1_1 [Lachancea mirantina]
MKGRTVFWYFWIFGLINNVLYVVIISAAADIVGPNLPKSLVLLVDILPSFIVKCSAPFFIHRISYRQRIWVLVLLSVGGMIMVSMRRLAVCQMGIILASFSSGLGEVTFLQLAHYYEHVSLNGWSSGTGGAGLVGSSVYMLLTSIFKLPIGLSLLVFSVLPFGFLLFFRLDQNYAYETIVDTEDSVPEAAPEVSDPVRSSTIFLAHFLQTVREVKPVVQPYMLPLSSVYFFEYLINQGVSPTLLFPLDDKHSYPFFFHKYRDIYVTYGTLYQLGVFISRSSAHYIRLKKLYLLSILQGVNLIFCLLQSWNYMFDSVWIIMLLVVYEGLLGGASYVNTFTNIIEEIEPSKREFSLGAVSMSDSFGTLLAAFSGILLEPRLCAHQVTSGRPWCELE